ncbi:hypothetical protein Prudu_002081, partial [Prunus dulcis]
KQVKSFNERAEALACVEAACLCDLSLSLGNPILIYVPKSESGRLTSANAEMQQPSDIADSGITIHARSLEAIGFWVDTSGISPHALHSFAEMSHSCSVCNGGTALFDFDLGYHMGIRDNGGGDSFGRGIEGLEAVRGGHNQEEIVDEVKGSSQATSKKR